MKIKRMLLLMITQRKKINQLREAHQKITCELSVFKKKMEKINYSIKNKSDELFNLAFQDPFLSGPQLVNLCEDHSRYLRDISLEIEFGIEKLNLESGGE